MEFYQSNIEMKLEVYVMMDFHSTQLKSLAINCMEIVTF